MGNGTNHFKLKRIKGGTLSVLEGVDKSGTAKLLNMVKGALDKVITADGEELELNDNQMLDIKMADGWKIALEVMKDMTKEEFPKMKEHFFCSVCSSPGYEKYTGVNESWHELVENGLIEEYFVEKVEDLSFWTELPVGLEMQPIGTKFPGGTFKRIEREPISIKDALRISHTPSATDSEARAVRAHWDLEIKSIEGIDQANLNRLVKNNIADSFTQKYLIDQDDIDAMRISTIQLGLSAENRRVTCKYLPCGNRRVLGFYKFFRIPLSEEIVPAWHDIKYRDGIKNIVFYPSVGNKNYPYIGWPCNRREYILNDLGVWAEWYQQTYRLFRNVYHWTPNDMDNVFVVRIIRMYNELKSDLAEGRVNQSF